MTYKYNPLSHECSLMLLSMLASEVPDAEEVVAAELPFLSAIVNKRITGMGLPINFTPNALLAVNAFVDRPGTAVLLLIDALTKFEGQTVTTSMLCDLYPFGFYDEASFTKIVDDELKPRKRKWAEIY